MYFRRYLPFAKAAVPWVSAAAMRFLKKRKAAKKPSLKRSLMPQRQPAVKRMKGGKQQSLKERIKRVEAKASVDMGVHIGRYRAVASLSCGNTTATYYERAFNRISEFEAVIANLQYYDPSNPGTLTTASGATGTFQRDIMFKSIYNCVRARNNYIFPVRLTCYFFQCKGDTNISPNTYRTDGIADVTSSTSTLLTYPTDSQSLMDQYALVKTLKKTLNPGDEFFGSIVHKDIKYDPSLSDSHTSEFQKRNKAGAILVRIEGIIAHNATTTSTVGTGPGQVDLDYRQTYTIEYPAGAKIKRIFVQDDQNALASNEISLCPVTSQYTDPGL